MIVFFEILRVIKYFLYMLIDILYFLLSIYELVNINYTENIYMFNVGLRNTQDILVYYILAS